MNDKSNRFDNAHYYGCPIEAALDVIGHKWKGVILYHLTHGTKRFSELQRQMPAVTQRMLTLQLRELENDGIIIRKVYPEIPPKVEYSLSKLGLKLPPILAELEIFGKCVMQSSEMPHTS